jgi:hypothetical protein
VSSSTIHPSIRYAARTPSDAPGTMGQGEGTIVAGTAQQTGASRWGDYASLNIDPVDDCTFWGTTEYKTSSGQDSWSTRVAAWSLPSCGSFQLAQPNPETVAQKSMASYPINTMTLAGAAQSVQLTATNLPTGVTASFNPPTIQSGGSSMITLTADQTAPLGPTHYTVVAAGAAASSMQDVMLTITAEGTNPPDGGGPGGGPGHHGGCCEAAAGDSPLGSMLLGASLLAVVLRRRRR